MKQLFFWIFLIFTIIVFGQNEENYVKETLSFEKRGDSLIFNYHYEFDRPDMCDEELNKKITFVLLQKDLIIGKNIAVANNNIPIGAIIYGNRVGDYKVYKLWGKIKILEIDKEYIKLSIQLSGVYGRAIKRREFINKTLLFKIT